MINVIRKDLCLWFDLLGFVMLFIGRIKLFHFFRCLPGLDVPGFLSVNFGVEKYGAVMYHQYFPLPFVCVL